MEVLVESAYLNAFVVGSGRDEISFPAPGDAVDRTAMMLRSLQQHVRRGRHVIGAEI